MALVLTRRAHEGFYVGDAHVVITRIGRSSVQVAIAAPRDVPVRRDELKPLDGQPGEQRNEPPGE